MFLLIATLSMRSVGQNWLIRQILTLLKTDAKINFVPG